MQQMQNNRRSSAPLMKRTAKPSNRKKAYKTAVLLSIQHLTKQSKTVYLTILCYLSHFSLDISPKIAYTILEALKPLVTIIYRGMR